MTTESNGFLIGNRVRMRAIKEVGSARMLNGVTAVVIGPHPIAHNWYRIKLDQNKITAEREWTVPGDRLVLCDTQAENRIPILQMVGCIDRMVLSFSDADPEIQ